MYLWQYIIHILNYSNYFNICWFVVEVPILEHTCFCGGAKFGIWPNSKFRLSAEACMQWKPNNLARARCLYQICGFWNKSVMFGKNLWHLGKICGVWKNSVGGGEGGWQFGSNSKKLRAIIWVEKGDKFDVNKIYNI